MKFRAAVIGSPVSHSRSPAIFRFLAEREALLDFEYSAIEVESVGLSGFLLRMKSEPGFVGINVTVPHKEAVVQYLDELSPEARALGAVNVVRNHEGRLKGFNTDVLGILKTFEENRCRVSGQGVWMWGAGGAARAAAYALGKLGARTVHICNRNTLRAQALVAQLGAFFPNTEFKVAHFGSDAGPRPLALLINATPLGMKGGPALHANSPIDASLAGLGELPLARDACAFDLIYVPERTPFLARAEELGLRPIGGLGMLIEQALATWELWFDSLKAPAFAREGLESHLHGLLRSRSEDPRPVFLTGFMGVGKSTTGHALARALGWDFVDTDQMVMKTAGVSIRHIFETQGENAFRALEVQAVLEASRKQRVVVSLGAGALKDEGTLEKILQMGHLVFLDADPESLQTRLIRTAETRPLLAGLGPQARLEKIKALLADRRPHYVRAHVRVTTDNKSPSEVATDILRSLP